VLDTIHGARTLAEAIESAGLRATALDVYHSSPEMEGYDLVVSPVHLWPGNPALLQARNLGKPVITHHQAVGDLLAGQSDLKVVEVTGTRGKTTTALILSLVLSFRHKVVSHTTRGIELWAGGKSRPLRSGLSITPANVLLAYRIALEERADILICEVSLGGTGLADVGIITSLEGDYLIAKNTLWASTAKLQMLALSRPGFRLVSSTDAKLSSEMTFGPGGQVDCLGDRLSFQGKSVPLELEEGFHPAGYLSAISAGAAASLILGLDLEEISSALEGFRGLEGRMKHTKLGSVDVYDNSNSGLRSSGVESALDYASGEGRLAAVVGEEAETVCEGMDIPRLLELLSARREKIDHLILVGRRLEPYALSLNAQWAMDLTSGFEMAKALSPDRILLCVKCFR
jgi:UDP-N-acetylmuramyl pentapeptide synthase